MAEQFRIIEADWTWTGRRFEKDVRIEVSPDGKITSVGPFQASPDLRLHEAALIPGLVNVHSHAFQRGLRGRAERFTEREGSFWTWREEMYRLASAMDAQNLYRTSLQAFREMLRCGITCVGEFHYLRHSGSSESFDLDEAVLRAASDSGIRMVLIPVYYRTGGIGKPLSPVQLRFQTSSLTRYWDQWNRLSRCVADRPTQTLGVSAHSVRAAPLDDMIQLCDRARLEGWPFHIHVEEQEQEVQDCQTTYGLRPLSLINKFLKVSPLFTAVHATHAAEADRNRFLDAGGNLCVCPITEAALGDGMPGLKMAGSLGDRLCVGTDSNSRISMNEELRWLEYVQRLQYRKRGILRDEEGSVARRLLQIGTWNGAVALGVPAGSVDIGLWADFAVIDLEAVDLSGWERDSLLAAFLLGADQSVLKGVSVGGCWTWFEQ